MAVQRACAVLLPPLPLLRTVLGKQWSPSMRPRLIGGVPGADPSGGGI